MTSNESGKPYCHGPWTKSLVLGTASWGNDYGVMNNAAMPVSSIRQVIQLAQTVGAAGLDTAPAYGESESQIGQAGTFDVPVYSKLSKRNGEPNAGIASVNNSLRKLGIKTLEGLTFHDAADFLANHRSSVLETAQLKELGKIRSWGVSVYSVGELMNILEVSRPDYIQAPANFFDRRFLDPEVRNTMRSAGAYFQYRSVFLQGILLADKNMIPVFFRKWNRAFELLESHCSGSELSRLSFLMSFMISASAGSQLVIGVNSLNHLKDLVSAEINYETSTVELGLEEDWLLPLIDPRRWQE
jgi:aryl-alcohol dehydrogenase-like predicted oxidoreductase